VSIRPAWQNAIVPETVIAQLAKDAIPGNVKTRLLPVLSAQAAADLHAAMVRHVCAELCSSGLGEVQLWVDGDPAGPLFSDCRLLGVAQVLRQRGGDLGERMANIAEYCLGSHSRVILVGSDAPTLDRAYLADAVALLEHSEVVFGPALDGGYVLLGLTCYTRELFEDMPWGTDRVLETSIGRLQDNATAFSLLRPLPDIDRPDDLAYLPENLARLTRL
jgi:rSAM/selenodomain-associated transferase 1